MKILNSYALFVSIIISSCLWRTSKQLQDTDCIHHCGNIAVPYPFGIGPNNNHCFKNPDFAVSCNSSSSKSIPFLKILNLEILNVEVSDDFFGTITINIPSLTACSHNGRTNTKAMWTSHSLNGSPFRFSNSENVFVSVGCDGYALFYNEKGGIVTGCTSVCSLNPPTVAVSTTGSKSRCYGYHCCQSQVASALVPSKYTPNREIKKYSVSVSTNNRSGSCRSAFLISKQYLEAKAPLKLEITDVPVVLEYDYYKPVTAGFDVFNLIPITISVVLPLIICGCCWGWWRFKTKKRRKEIKLRAKYFKDRLVVQGSSYRDTTEKLFTLTELKRFTDNFSKDRVLGQGGQGTVYKGMLKDGQVIAVKRSRAFDESQWNEFINEVILLSQIKHRHVVKILGCCLEDDIPLLVYEFISNGTLSQHIQKSIDYDFIFTWDERLRIAFEVATAIAYLHSEFSTPIYHRDIKSSNILLDEKFRAKLSDFGISRAISVEQTHLTTCVQGTFGYLDPEYFFTSQYTEKSDVYSFGVLLVELLTGQKPIRAPRAVHEEEQQSEDEEERSLAMYFVSSMNVDTLLDIVDPMVLEGSSKEGIMEFARLAKQCLNPTGLERPTMKEVTMVLEGLRYRNSPVMSLKPNDQAEDWTTRSSSMITSSMETSNGYQRSLTYDHIDLITTSVPAEVEMRLLHTS